MLCVFLNPTQAYRALARRHHPDLLPATAKEVERSSAHQNLVKVNAAFAVLGVESKRRQYDMAQEGPIGLQTNARGYGGTYGSQAQAASPSVDSNGFDSEGFFHGAHKSKREPFASDTTVLVIALVWMVAGVAFHFWRFGEARIDVTEYIEESNRKASSHLTKAKQRAHENGIELQLAMLRDQHGSGSVLTSSVVEHGPAVPHSHRWSEQDSS
jgi:DnaJ-class molecular chaperone